MKKHDQSQRTHLHNSTINRKDISRCRPQSSSSLCPAIGSYFLGFVFKATGCLLPYAPHCPCCPVFLLHCFLSLLDLAELFDVVLYIYVWRQDISFFYTADCYPIYLCKFSYKGLRQKGLCLAEGAVNDDLAKQSVTDRQHWPGNPAGKFGVPETETEIGTFNKTL